jgi:hypothetical protein
MILDIRGTCSRFWLKLVKEKRQQQRAKKFAVSFLVQNMKRKM